MKNWKKKLVSVLLAGGILAANSAMAVQASVADSSKSALSVSAIPSRGSYCSQIITSAWMVPAGCAFMGEVFGNSQTTQLVVDVYLQEYRNNAWVSVDVESKTVGGNNPRYCYVSGVYENVISKRKYRSKIQVRAYSGGSMEFYNYYSAVVTAA